MKLSKRQKIEYLLEAISTVAAIITIQFMPEEMMFVGTTKSRWMLVLLSASPAFFTFAVGQIGKESLFTSIYLAVAELGAVMLVLYNKGIFTPNFEIIGLSVLAILFIFEAIHLGKDHPMGTSMCINFKWVENEESWKELQKKGSLLVFLEGILIAVGTLLLAFHVVKLGVVVPVILVTFYVMVLYLMKTSK